MRQRFRSARLNMYLAEVRFSTHLRPCANFTRCRAVSARPAGAVRVSQLGNQLHSSGRGSTFRVHAQQNFSTQLIRVGQGANQIFVAGADGQLGARIVQKLLQAGFKVTAGVVDEEQAQSAVSFATTVELLKKQEAQKLSLKEIDLTDVESITAALPKKARLVVVVGDSGATKGPKIDARAATRFLQAAQEVDASQYVLVAPTGSGGGGGFLGALFGGGAAGGSGSKPSKLEQEIASSGLDFVIVRTGRTDVPELDFEASNNVAVGAQGSLPQQARITKNQVAEVVSQVIRLADNDVLVEAWAAQEAPAVGVEEAVLQALPEAAIENEEEEDEEEAGGVAGAAEAVEEAVAPKSPGGLFGSFGTRRVKAGGDASAEGPTSPTAGTRRVGVRSATQQGDAETPRKPAFGIGRKASAVAEEEEEEEASYNPAEALRGIFGSKKKDDAVPAVSPENARKSAARGIKAAGNAVQKASTVRGQQRPGTDEAKPKKGFLESLGFGGKTTFIDNDD